MGDMDPNTAFLVGVLFGIIFTRIWVAVDPFRIHGRRK